jgi:hypothetical protein
MRAANIVLPRISHNTVDYEQEDDGIGTRQAGEDYTLAYPSPNRTRNNEFS